MSDYTSRNLNRRLDLCGTLERIAKQEQVRKEQRQTPQQVAADSAAAYERGFRSAYTEAHRQINLKRLAESDPAMFFFLTKNRTPGSA